MSNDGVHGGDMAHPELSDEQLSALLDGNSDELAGHPVADALVRAREQLGAEPVPPAGAALSEFLGVGHVTDPIPLSAEGEFIEPGAAEPSPRRTPVLTSLSAFVGTLAGKIFVSGTVAAASLSGAHAAGVVDIPGLPDVDQPAVVETLPDTDDGTLDLAPDDSGDTGDADETNGDDSQSATATTSTIVPDTTVPDTTIPGTTMPDTTMPATTQPSTTVPTNTVPSNPVPTPTVPTTTMPPSTSTTAAPATTTTKAYTVAGVGTTTVTVTNGQISLVSAVPAAGWTLDEAGPDATGVESKYTKGELETRIDFEIEDGQLRVRVRERNDATDERTERFEYFPL